MIASMGGNALKDRNTLRGLLLGSQMGKKKQSVTLSNNEPTKNMSEAEN